MATTAKPKRQKPKKPYPTFPLTPHANGQWCKKIRSKVHFFGVWDDFQAALDLYHKQAADLHAGRQATVPSGEVSVKDLANQYLTFQEGREEAGHITAGHLRDCISILRHFAGYCGKQRPVASLRADEFERYKNRLATQGVAGKPWGPYALTRAITVVKAMFRYGVEADTIESLPRFGNGFSKPSAREFRRSKQANEAANGKRLFTTQQLCQIIKSCTMSLRSCVLLGINGGFGNTDCATLPTASLNLEGGVVDYCRPKTGVQRVVPLWPETADALREWFQSDRPQPYSEEDANLVFLSETGRPLVRSRRRDTSGSLSVTNIDRLGHQFNAVLESLNLKRKGIGFYTLRHTFRTWADETKDQHAIHRIMGHAIPGMSGIYVEDIELSRLRAVVDHVRRKVFPDTKSPTGSGTGSGTENDNDNTPAST